MRACDAHRISASERRDRIHAPGAWHRPGRAPALHHVPCGLQAANPRQWAPLCALCAHRPVAGEIALRASSGFRQHRVAGAVRLSTSSRCGCHQAFDNIALWVTSGIRQHRVAGDIATLRHRDMATGARQRGDRARPRHRAPGSSGVPGLESRTCTRHPTSSAGCHVP